MILGFVVEFFVRYAILGRQLELASGAFDVTRENGICLGGDRVSDFSLISDLVKIGRGTFPSARGLFDAECLQRSTQLLEREWAIHDGSRLGQC